MQCQARRPALSGDIRIRLGSLASDLLRPMRFIVPILPWIWDRSQTIRSFTRGPTVQAPEPALKIADQSAKRHITWARLLKRTFEFDVETCHGCGGKMKIVAAIEYPHAIKKMLERLGLATRAPMPWSARGPPSTHDHDFGR